MQRYEAHRIINFVSRWNTIRQRHLRSKAPSTYRNAVSPTCGLEVVVVAETVRSVFRLTISHFTDWPIPCHHDFLFCDRHGKVKLHFPWCRLV